MGGGGRVVDGWVGVQNETKANYAVNKFIVKVEA